jgi:hypothetical protein
MRGTVWSLSYERMVPGLQMIEARTRPPFYVYTRIHVKLERELGKPVYVAKK